MSPFGRRPDRQCHDREGQAYSGTIEFFFDEVRDYKHRILDEVLQRDVDGLMLDFARHNATPSGDAQGIHRFGYNPEIRESYAQAHGQDPLDLPPDDPDWLAFKNGYRAQFVRSLRDKLPDEKPMDLMTPPNFDQYRWLCLDLPALSRDGTFDRVMPFSMTYCSSPSSTKRDVESLRSQIRGRHTKVVAAVQAYWGVNEDHLQHAIAAARDVSVREVMLYEANHLMNGVYRTIVRAANLDAMPIDRSVTVRRLKRVPTATDWERAEHHEGFFIAAGPDRLRPTARTAFSVLASPNSLHMRVVCRGEQGEIDPAKLDARRTFIDLLGARNYWLMQDKAHFFVDPGATRRDYCHFSVQRDGQMTQQTRHDNEWAPQWDAEIHPVSKTRWEAYWHLPFVSLGARPKAGDRWGFQVAREQAATREGSTYFVSTAYGFDPAEWGDLVFE